MGSFTSKVAKPAAGAARRQYPQRVPPPPSSNAPSAPPAPAGQPTDAGPTVHPRPEASNARTECKVFSSTVRLNITDDNQQPSTLMHLIPISHDPFVLSALSSPAQLSRIHQPLVLHHLHHRKALKAHQTSHIHKSSPTLAKILH